MSKIDYQALREAAEAIKIAATPQKLLAFRMKATPQVVLELLDELEIKSKRINELIKGGENAKYVTEIFRLEKERMTLVAENAVMLETIEAVRSVADNSSGIAGWHLNGDIATWEEILPEINDIETPATDAFLADVRAVAFNELRAAFVRHAKVAGLDDADTVTLKEVTEALLHCAEQIRAPE
ncbi:ead/Ea22-like family protein [Escherichia coli]|uniref:Ead/Ea22-like family protein n=1 Tax=Escherichia coli TaxID=562 RepID=A0AAN5UIZ9_ECOLX|nr:ead/Ea22-like family protein [Escherichia coli]EFA3720394.1 ead/Ea22-like family protein [Escherichia coli]EFM6524495.1 ead/Ea22-like family protein [Escherichia coli]EIY3405276.1 ead/Ea22-like family protein [Escherichia coli]HAZ7494696.1 ead/Ea22-like family protein [Escherichia coli]HCN6590538.1 ead/Ea22-like family protein [Escherichia coli]